LTRPVAPSETVGKKFCSDRDAGYVNPSDGLVAEARFGPSGSTIVIEIVSARGTSSQPSSLGATGLVKLVNPFSPSTFETAQGFTYSFNFTSGSASDPLSYPTPTRRSAQPSSQRSGDAGHQSTSGRAIQDSNGYFTITTRR